MNDLRARYGVGFAYHFGIRPWEIDLLTPAEFYSLCDAVEEIDRKAAENA